MNIIEALKSGKRFRRAGFTQYYGPNIYDRYFCHDEILADDWEVESVLVTITREQFVEAWENITKYIADTQPFFRPDLAQEMLCRKLGL